MASCITSQFGNSYCPQVQLVVSVSNKSNTTATVSWQLKWITHGYTISSSASKAYSVKIGGTTVKSGSFAYGGKTSRTIASGTRDISRTTSSQSITCSFTFAMTFNWNGVTGKSQTKSCSVTVSARPKYTITYNANGGSGAPGVTTYYYGYNTTLSSTKPTRTGYTFLGWSLNSTATSASYSPGQGWSGTNANNYTLYAVWKIITYTISYNANGGSGAPSSQTKNYGSSIKLSTTKPTRTNYNFKGWATSANGSVMYASGATYSSNSSITLYAVWELAYTPPSISSLKVSRCNSSGVLTDTGTYAKLSFSWSCSQLIGPNPVVSIVAEWSTDNQSGIPTNQYKIPAIGNNGSVSDVIGEFDVDHSFYIYVKIKDSKGGSGRLVAILPTAGFYLDFKSGGSGVAIGKVAEEAGLLDVGYESRFLNPAMFSAGLKEKLPVISNADMNTITESGKYYLINPPTNSPIAKSGYLEVMRYEKEAGFVYQRFTTYDGNKFERVCVSGVWDKWCGFFRTTTYEFERYMDGRIVYRQPYETQAKNISWSTDPKTGYFYGTLKVNLPESFIKTISHVNIQCVRNGTSLLWLWRVQVNQNTVFIGIYAYTNESTNMIRVEIEAAGYWKTAPIITPPA